jgi:radical SAM protein with 4Fe4S-binding SPASM domain
MTVTPDNVGQLFETIVTLSEQGLSRIMHQPALELPWPGPAVDLWRDQHQQLADWACRRYEDRQPLPDLTVLEGIVRRLEGQAATYCGAGVRIGAVTPDGKIYGCYRSAYDPRGDKMALGDIFGGPVNEPLVRAYAQLHPHRARPERGECRRCPARAGCTIFCPATGHVLCGDLRAVSATACALLREQVAVCDEILRRMRRIDRRRRRRRVGSHVAAAALAFSLAGGAAGCDDETSKPDGPVGGICPVQVDSALNDGRVDGPVGGVCPVQQPDGQILDGPQPGLCPVPPPDARAEGPQPGVCPIAPDLHPKPKKDGMPQPGFCPIMPDAMVGGVCPVPAPDGGHKPGLC